MAQLVIAAAGAALGGALAPAGFAFLGMSGAQLGWMAGSLVGSMLNKPPGQAGPRLDDSALRVTGTEYGQCIPWVAGAPRVPGIIIWASDRHKTTTTEEVGKGGGQEYTTYSYDVDALYLIADRPGCVVTRIWMNGKLVWTSLADSDGDSRLASQTTDKWRRLTVYPGNDDQLPDPTYDAAVVSATAYRRRTTVFIEGLQLGNSGALPNFTFEVAQSATEVNGIARFLSRNDLSEDYSGADGPVFKTVHLNAIFPVVVAQRPNDDQAISASRVKYFDNRTGSDTSGSNPSPWIGEIDYGYSELSDQRASQPIGVVGGFPVRLSRYNVSNYVTGTPSICHVAINRTSRNSWDDTATDAAAVLPAGVRINGCTMCSDREHLFFTTSDNIYPQFASAGSFAWHIVKISGGAPYLVSQGTFGVMGVNWPFSERPTIQQGASHATIKPGASIVHMLESDLRHVWVANRASRSVFLLEIDDAGVLQFVASLLTGSGIPSYKPGSSSEQASIWAESGYAVVVSGSTISSYFREGNIINSVTLRTVVQDLCARAGMPAGTYDASALAAITTPVRALAIPQLSSARATLDMLMTSHRFVAALSDKLYFVPRGTTVDATIAWGDLGTGEGDASDDPLAIQIGNDLELPAQMAVQYRNMTADQQTGVEYSDRVISGQASVQPMQMALGMLPSEAKGVADALQLDGIAAQVSASVSVPLTYAKLWPGSVVTLVGWDGAQYRMRVTRREDDGLMLRLDVVGDDPAALTSASITDGSYTVVQTVQALDGTSLEVLDIPILRDDDDALGYYVAARSQAAGRWPGAVVQASRDTVTFRTVATVSEPAVIGQTTSALQNWTRGAIMDEVSFVDVNVGAGELASVTREQLLADASVNAMLIGSEVIRFATATLQSANPNVYRLRRLLRGQRGTEWATAGHASVERAVLLRARGLRRVVSDAAELAALQKVRAATIGTVATDAAPQNFTLAGVGLKPFSPVNLRASSAALGGVRLTWDRRTRRTTVIRNGVGVQHPLGEAVEAYEIDVFNAANALIEQLSVIGTTSATLGSPVQLRTWARDSTDVFEYGGNIFGANTYGAGGSQKFDASRALVAEIASFTSYGDSTTRINRMVHDGAGTAYALLTPQLIPGLIGIVAVKVLKIALSTMTVTASCDVYASAAAGYGNLHFYSGAVYAAGSDGSGNTVLAKITASTMAFDTSVTITGVGSYAIADDGAGNVCMVVGTQYRPYNAGTLAAGTPATLASAIYATELRRVGSVLWAYGYGDVSVAAISLPSGALVTTHATGMISGSPIATSGSSVVMQSANVASAPGSTTVTPGDLVVYNATTGALQQRSPFQDKRLSAVLSGGNYVANVASSTGTGYVATEFGPPGNMAGGRAVIYQISATVGRGYPAEITL